MRDYGKVHTSFWTSSTIGSLSEDARTLAFYLLTSPHSTISGVFRLPDGYACEDLGWVSERVEKGFRELFEKGFANRCETTKWVYIYKHFDWNKPENPNQRKAAKRVALMVPDECTWKPDFMRDWRDFLHITEDEFPNPSETVKQPFLNQKQQQEQEQEQEQEKAAASTVATESRDPSSAAALSDPIQKRALEICQLLRPRGAAIQPGNPPLRRWAEQGVTDAQALQALDIAQQRRENAGSSSPINAGYLDSILADVIASPPPGKRPASRAQRVSDWMHEAAESVRQTARPTEIDMGVIDASDS